MALNGSTLPILHYQDSFRQIIVKCIKLMGYYILDGKYFVYFVNLCVPNIDIESLLVMNIHEASELQTVAFY
jgi:hypothetical protein